MILSLLLGIPLLGAFLVALMPVRFQRWIRGVAITHAFLALALSLGLWPWFDTQSGLIQFSERILWNPRLGTYYALGIDGFSYPMVVLTTLLCLVSLMTSQCITQGLKGYYFPRGLI